jgi:hypothetical protein
MSAAGLLFITAPAADHKVINRLVLHLRDWQNGEDPEWDVFHVVSRKDPELYKSLTTSGDVNPTQPPCQEDLSNEWQNSTLEEVEAFVLSLKDGHINTSIYVLLDEKGLEDKTCIVGERRFDDETEEQMDVFNKARVPWEEVTSMFVNLDIANVDFEDFCNEENGDDEDNWFTWNSSEFGAALGLDEDELAKRGEAIKKLEDEGKA